MSSPLTSTQIGVESDTRKPTALATNGKLNVYLGVGEHRIAVIGAPEDVVTYLAHAYGRAVEAAAGLEAVTS